MRGPARFLPDPRRGLIAIDAKVWSGPAVLQPGFSVCKLTEREKQTPG